MSTVEQIEAAILKLSPQELSQLAGWVLDLDEQRWDQQLEEDIAAGKLDFLAQEALAEKDGISWVWIGTHAEYDKLID